VKARRDLVLLIVGLGIQVALSLHVRLRAWPETLVPAYLVSRGWVLYRDVKFAHMPLWIGIEAMVGGAFGFNVAALRVLSLGPALAAHAGVWRAGAVLSWKAPARIGASLFFLATFYLWDGNAVYPDVAIAVLAVPAFLALRRRTPRGAAAAGLLLGSAIAMKQPAAFAVAASAAWLAFSSRRLLVRLLLFAAVPGILCAAVFAALGELREFLLWTVVVPLRDYRGRTSLGVGEAQVPVVFLGALVLAVFLVFAGRRPGRGDSGLLVLLALGFAAMAYPKFELVHLIAAVPLLALAAGETFEGAAGAPSVLRFAAAIPAAVIALDAAFLATGTSSGEVSFWSSSADDAIVRRLEVLPAAPLFLYGPDQNLFIRARRFPPGSLYVNPDLWYQLRGEGLEERQIAALRGHPETIVLSSGGGAVQTGDSGKRLEDWMARTYGVFERPAASVPGRPSPARPSQ
jgi:hypothetical protein